MNLDKSNLRAFIKNLITESLNSLEEAQRGDHFNTYINLALSNITPFIDPLTSKGLEIKDLKTNEIIVMKEVEKLLNIKIDKILSQTFNYNDFYIVKLGDFIINTNQGEIKLSFNKKGDELAKYSYPYIYLYHDMAEVLRFGSRFLDTDAAIIKNANEFLKNRKIDLNPKAEKGVKKALIKQEPGKIVIIGAFDTNNTIDMVDWSKMKRPVAPKKDVSPKLKNKYTAGQPFVHNLYGKGVIKKTKKFDVDASGNQLYDILVDFDGKEKKFRVGTKSNPRLP